MNLILRSIVIGLFFFTSISYAFSEEKVSFIDMEFIIKNSNAGKIILKNINDLNSQNISKLKLKEKTLKDKEKSIIEKKNILSNEEYEKEINKFKIQINEFRNEKDMMVNDLSKYKDKELSDLYKKINPIIKNYMDTNNIKILLDVKNIIVGKTSSDITKQIMDEVNKQIR